ncbi:uncharacterized protein BDZ99DRAFT_503718 [Mytilinidion resinicola]|uniref:Xylanolytic transcriptional activator regulatory domain-containing protein n=1 Tax=Mytilinidion resinicola TaxID=574789 RepID=A0A6A6Y4N7_9PEZI|nr:uncharacterized protein BDZ99DRAFT_503718 [Mytilinidion resinicola]KAF2802757.1 hypothetical protein BDZ99DRAFT_503718 [Mytilinidion resinicola]
MDWKSARYEKSDTSQQSIGRRPSQSATPTLSERNVASWELLRNHSNHLSSVSAYSQGVPSIPDDILDDILEPSAFAAERDSWQSFDSLTRVENDHHPLDHDIPVGTDHGWSKTWAEDLCADFSSLAPLHFIDRFSEGPPTKDHLSVLSKQIWTKSRRSSENADSQSQDDSVPPYADPDTAQFIDVFFNGCYGYSSFVTRQYVEDTLAAIVASPNAVDQCAYALVNGVLAIGCRNAIRKDSPRSNTIHAKSIYWPSRYFSGALKYREYLTNGQPSFLKLQALTALILYLRQHRNVSLMRSVLSQAIHMIQELISRVPKSPFLTAIDGNHQQEIQRLFWLLYSIEKPFTLRFGGHSMIDDDLVVFPAPSKRRDSMIPAIDLRSGWEVVSYRYARLCSVIVKTIYSHAALRMSRSETLAAIDRLSKMLEAWRMSIPVAYRPDCNLDLPACQNRSWDTCIQSDIFLKFAEASFAIHRWAVIQHNVVQDATATYSSSRDQCIELAKGVLHWTHYFRVDDHELDWHRIFLPLLSAATIFIAICKQEVGKDCLPFLGMACGYFGRLSTSECAAPNLFEEISELYLMAHRKLNAGEATDLAGQST